jgi:glycosyltransferase involved in cell wall biosynthesis
MSPARVSVVVPSHGRALRLRWLLNALEEQTVPADCWEAIVVHDYPQPERARMLDDHPLVRSGMARLVAIAPGTGSPARQRNHGWRRASAPLVAFVDDDCRPDPRWLEQLLAAAEQRPATVVQGATCPDPFEHDVLAAPHVRSMRVEPPTWRAQTCNILYPRALLERLEGFDERAIVGEDVELGIRARAAGAGWTAAPEAVVYHSIEAFTIVGTIRQNWKWRHLPYLARRHPQVRRRCPAGIFFDPERLELALALGGLAGAGRWRPVALLALPYARRALSRRGSGWRNRAVAAAELPGVALVDLADLAGRAFGSARYRTPLL